MGLVLRTTLELIVMNKGPRVSVSARTMVLTMPWCRVAAFVMVSVFALGCGDLATRGIPDGDVIVDDRDVLGFEDVGRGVSATGVDTVLVTLVSSPTVWGAYSERFSPLLPFKPVNFTERNVLVVATPVAETGFSTRVEFLEGKADTLFVRVVQDTPGKTCFTSAIPNTPFHVVSLAKRPFGTIEVEWVEEPMRCSLEER